MQAHWLAQAYQQARKAGVQKVFWLFLRDANINAGYFNSMGLMDAQNNQRPAWKVFLSSAKFCGARPGLSYTIQSTYSGIIPIVPSHVSTN